MFHDDAERVTSFLRPHWSLALQGRANVVQSLPDMLEVLPSGASKGAGVQILLDHLDISPDQVNFHNILLFSTHVYKNYDNVLINLFKQPVEEWYIVLNVM